VPVASQGVQAWDRYAYVNNNPLKYNDPTGHDVGCGGRDAGDCSSYGILSTKIVQEMIFQKNEQLANEVKEGDISSLDAFTELISYSVSFTPSNAEKFINNLGAVLTGLSHGNAAGNEILEKLGIIKYDSYYLLAGKFGQNGVAEIFQDPNEIVGGNTTQHFWFYVEVGFQSGFLAGVTGDYLHETILSTDYRGNSYEDIFLGIEGILLGEKLAAGNVKPSDVSDYISSSLSFGSPQSSFWENVYNKIPIHVLP
jgi:hypothetical protein